jgi:hypothetical protein
MLHYLFPHYATMIKPDICRSAGQHNVILTAKDTIKPYSQIIKRIVSSVWKLLLVNILLLIMIIYVLMFTDAPMHEDFYMSDAILNGFAFYFTVFPCFKILVQFISLYICKTRLNLYRMQMAEVISESDYDTYLKRPLRKIQTLFLTLPLVLLMHLIMAYVCYRLK